MVAEEETFKSADCQDLSGFLVTETTKIFVVSHCNPNTMM